VRKEVVEEYLDGVRVGDRRRVLGCLTDDVTWDRPGHAYLEGKAAFGGELRDRPAVLALDRLVEEGDAVVAIGSGEATREDGSTHRFAFVDVFDFRGERIAGIASYVVALSDAPA
jgi:ketosteroid isomerase-like protein